MGQKVHPHGFRLGFNKTWRSRWFADKDYAKLLHEDLKLRDTLKTRFAHAGVSKIEIERAANKLKIDIYTSRPGIIIGRKGTEVDKLKTGDPEEDEPRSLHQYPGDPEAGARRAADWRIGRDAAREARGVPPGDAQGGRVGAALRRARHQGAGVGALERRRNRAVRVVSARPAAAADAARRHRLRLCRGEHDIRRRLA